MRQQRVVGLHLVFPASQETRPENYIFLGPDSVLVSRRDDREHHLLQMQYGRPPKDVDRFVELLKSSHALSCHAVFLREDHNRMAALRRRLFQSAAEWSMKKACAAFKNADAFLAYMMAQARAQPRFFPVVEFECFLGAGYRAWDGPLDRLKDSWRETAGRKALFGSSQQAGGHPALGEDDRLQDDVRTGGERIQACGG